MTFEGRVPPWMFVANLLIVGLASFFVVSLLIEVTRPQAVPRAGVSHREPAPPVHGDGSRAVRPRERIDAFNVIVARSLFNEARSERAVARTARATVPVPPKPVLHGVVIDGPQSVAYMEELGTRRAAGYRVGDTIAGGRIIKIGDDGVVIRRVDGQVEISLNDPAKPVPIPERVTAPPEDQPPAGAPPPHAPDPTPLAETPREISPGGTQPPSLRDLD